MKTKMALLIIALSVWPQQTKECWTIDVSAWINVLRQSGGSYPSNYQTKYGAYKSKSLCEEALAAEISKEPGMKGRAYCVQCKGSSGGEGASGDPIQSFMNWLVDLAFGSTRTPAQEAAARQEEFDREEAARLAEEAARLEREREDAAARDAWNADKKSAALNQKMEADKKREDRDKLLGNIKTVGGSELTFKTIGPDFFGTGNPIEVKLQPKGGVYPTKELKTVDLLQGAAYFMQNAAQASDPTVGDYEGARFLAEQADKMIQRQPTDVPWRLAPMPQIPMPLAPEQVEAKKQKLVTLCGDFKEKVISLQDIGTKINGLRAQITQRESEKGTAQAELKKAQEAAVAAKPEEKSEADRQAELAKALLQKAEEALAKAKQAESDQAREAEKLKSDIKNIGQEIQKLNK